MHCKKRRSLKNLSKSSCWWVNLDECRSSLTISFLQSHLRSQNSFFGKIWIVLVFTLFQRKCLESHCITSFLKTLYCKHYMRGIPALLGFFKALKISLETGENLTALHEIRIDKQRYGIRLSHIFETSSISNVKPSISDENLVLWLEFLIGKPIFSNQNFQIIGF